VVVLVAFVLASLFARAARWQVFFLPGRHVPFSPLVGTLAISYMASTFLPLRAGELVRAVFLGQREQIPISAVIGTILVEKLFDFLAIAVMLALLVMLVPLPAAAQVAGISITAVIILGFAFTTALAIWRKPTLDLIGHVESRLPFGLGARGRIQEAARNFAEGTDSLRVGRLWALALAWTVVIWVLGTLATMAGMRALDVEPALPAALMVMVLTNSSQAVPSSPGYVGVYHAAATLALTQFGVDPATAIGIALITHAFSYAALVVAGLVALWFGGYTLSDVLKGSRSRVGTAPVSAEL
jgi:uncharacterized protein (TIRG00374 family)